MELIKLKKGAAVSAATYKKISSPDYLYHSLLYYMEKAGYTKPAMIGILCYVMNEGRPFGFYTYQGCYLNKGTDPNRKNPHSVGYKPVFDNDKWRNWISVDTVNLLGSYGHHTIGLSALGILSETDVWGNGFSKPKTQTLCTNIIDAADAAGLDCHDPELLCTMALKLIEGQSWDADYRNPKTFNGTAKEYAERVLCFVGMCGWSYGRVPAGYERYYSSASVAAATKVYDAYKAADVKPLPATKMVDHFIAALPAISKGSEGEMVKILQTELKRFKYYNGDIDGDAGAVTVAAIKQLQKDWKITVDGSFGPQCWTKLIKG